MKEIEVQICANVLYVHFRHPGKCDQETWTASEVFFIWAGKLTKILFGGTVSAC